MCDYQPHICLIQMTVYVVGNPSTTLKILLHNLVIVSITPLHPPPPTLKKPTHKKKQQPTYIYLKKCKCNVNNSNNNAYCLEGKWNEDTSQSGNVENTIQMNFIIHNKSIKWTFVFLVMYILFLNLIYLGYSYINMQIFQPAFCICYQYIFCKRVLKKV